MLRNTRPQLTRQQQKDLRDRVKAVEFHRGPFTPRALFLVIPPAALILSCPFLIALSDATPYFWLFIPCVALLPLIVVWLMSVRNEKINRIELGRLLLALGVRPNRCGRCGYDTRGSNADTCSECGEPLAVVPPGPIPGN